MTAALLAVNHVSEADAQFWVGLLIVAACLGGAGFAAWRAVWAVAAGLVVVAVFAAILLL